jgi:monoterpene epsilon-lactone hydrolase
MEENQIIDFSTLWNKVMEGNSRWFEGEDVRGLLTMKEMRLIAKLHRFIVEFRANRNHEKAPIMKEVKIEPIVVDGISAEWETISGVDQEKVILYFHGGGYIMGSPNFARMISVRLGKITKMRVLSIDYRLAPEHPYPQGLEDCIASYKWLVTTGIKPENIIISGDSAGGYFTLMTIINLRNKGIPLPAGAICFSPATDLAMTGESIVKNGSTDPILADLGVYWWVECYLLGEDPFSPEVSPIYADLSNLPPILIQATSSEMLYDEAKEFVELARKAGVDATLQTWEESLHEFQINDLPESTEAFSKAKQFVDKVIT